MRIISFKDAMREAQEYCLEHIPGTFIIGEGVPDVKGVFGTTLGLKEKFPNQVFDMPVSENGMTGVCIGAAINGMRPILVHMRMDFSLYSADQLINNAAKWFSMYGGQRSVPMVVRMLIGRGWGGGNQHTQNLTALYAHVPGLKIVVPSNAYDAKALFISSVLDPNPVLFVEHRWLYETTSDVPEGLIKEPIGKAKYITRGNDITVVAWGHALKEARVAVEHLVKQGASIDLIDLRSVAPWDKETVLDSARRTKRLLVVDDAWYTGSFAGEVVASVCENVQLKDAPERVCLDDWPAGSSPVLTEGYYPDPFCIGYHISGMLDAVYEIDDLFSKEPHDVPDKSFRGPF